MTIFYITLITIFSIFITNLFLFIWKKYFILNENLEFKSNNIFVSKILKKDNIDFIVFSIYGLITLIYLISFRFFHQWQELSWLFANQDGYKYLTIYRRSIILSKGFLLDMCPFMSLAISTSFIFDKTKIVTALLSPFAILGGLITLPFITLNEPNETFDFHYIFFGTETNPLFFIMHLHLIVAGIIGLRRYQKQKYIDYIYLHIVAALYFGYILIVSRILNVQYNVTGVVENDWNDPYYGTWYNFKKIMNLDYPMVMIVGYMLGYIFIILVWTIKIYYVRIYCLIKNKLIKQS